MREDMQKEFTKADLKDGMVVEYKNGKRRLVVADMLIGKDGFLTLNSYSEELKIIVLMRIRSLKLIR